MILESKYIKSATVSTFADFRLWVLGCVAQSSSPLSGPTVQDYLYMDCIKTSFSKLCGELIFSDFLAYPNSENFILLPFIVFCLCAIQC